MFQSTEEVDIRLYLLLQNWMRTNMVFDHKRRDPKFVTQQRMAVIEAERQGIEPYE